MNDNSYNFNDCFSNVFIFSSPIDFLLWKSVVPYSQCHCPRFICHRKLTPFWNAILGFLLTSQAYRIAIIPCKCITVLSTETKTPCWVVAMIIGCYRWVCQTILKLWRTAFDNFACYCGKTSFCRLGAGNGRSRKLQFLEKKWLHCSWSIKTIYAPLLCRCWTKTVCLKVIDVFFFLSF